MIVTAWENSLVRDCFKLPRSVIESLTGFVGQLEDGNTVANTIPEAHYDYKRNAINIRYERKDRGEKGCYTFKIESRVARRF
jgi:hypothetical protein